MMQVVKLDKRYDGFGFFSHRVEFNGGWTTEARKINSKQWIRARNWLWGQFGPSAEQHLARADNFDGVQPVWAWDAEKSSLYLTNGAYTMFMLKKEYWENVENL